MIHLVRHAETPGNAARVFQQPDTPLSDAGRAQARALGARFAGEPVGRVLTSDYARAEETARCVAEATGAPLAFAPELRERSFGELRGTPYAELAFDPFAADYVPPGGESWDLALGAEHALAATGIPNTAVSSLEPQPPFRVHTLACTAHLGAGR